MTKGMAMNAVHSSRAESLSSLGITSSLTVKDLTRAITGFSKMMKFRDEDFQCNNCGETPEYIVCDGKSIGPAKRKVEHLEELDREDGDMTPLGQGSNFKDRVFLSMKQERDLVKNLLTDEISIDDFIESEFPTENGQLVQSLARRLAGVWPLELPAPYSKFLAVLPSIQVLQATCKSCLMILWCIFLSSARKDLTYDLLKTESSSNLSCMNFLHCGPIFLKSSI